MVRRRTPHSLLLAVLLGTLIGLFISPTVETAAATSPGYSIKEPNLFIYVPSNAAQFQPVQVLVAMHGMGGDGARFCQDLLAAAERNGWIVVAPTFKYQDYKNSTLVLQDDTAFLPRLKAMIDSVPQRTGLQTRDKVLLYGHSRGGQAVHRFATYYPERVAGVAALSAGSYTLPLRTMLINGRSQTLPMPYGVADMRKHLGRDFDYEAFKRIPFRIVVGGRDSNPNDTPAAWDPYLGMTRVDRARAYTKVLQDIGVQATLAVYPDAGHGVSPQMLDDALAFLQGAAAKQGPLPYGSGLSRGGATTGDVVTGALRRR